mmetsp:Transcript_12095/g.54950  ORF Transcript_12095/g.54950 Transcript_12095/m.54950 type:complete len:231 (+) Transcript_12095:101-793(+)
MPSITPPSGRTCPPPRPPLPDVAARSFPSDARCRRAGLPTPSLAWSPIPAPSGTACTSPPPSWTQPQPPGDRSPRCRSACISCVRFSSTSPSPHHRGLPRSRCACSAPSCPRRRLNRTRRTQIPGTISSARCFAPGDRSPDTPTLARRGPRRKGRGPRTSCYRSSTSPQAPWGIACRPGDWRTPGGDQGWKGAPTICQLTRPPPGRPSSWRAARCVRPQVLIIKSFMQYL